MWPRALAQLLELLPHLARLIPLADGFLKTRAVDAEAGTRAMEAVAAGLRTDLAQVTASHEGLYRQLNEQDEKLSQLASDVHISKISIDTASKRLTLVEEQLSLITKLTMGLCAGLAVVIVLIGVLSMLLYRQLSTP